MTTAQLIESPLTKIMVGMSMIGDWPNHIYAFIGDTADTELRCALYHTSKREVPVTEADIQSEEVTAHLVHLKAEIRKIMGGAIEKGMKRDALMRSYEVRDNFKNMNKPAPQGTVAEIAAAYNVSLSRVRLLKREGRLAELTNPTE